MDELHASARRKFKRRRVIVRGLNDLYQADLVEMIPYAKSNRNFKYILVVIDVFSKYVWAEPVKTKTGNEVTKAMKRILKNPPSNLQTDQGKEFYNKEFTSLMKTLNINHYSSFSSMKASVVERVNRTLKNLMWKAFTLQGNNKWLDLLPIVVEKYNNTVHGTIMMKPVDVNKRNENKILKTAFNHPKIAIKSNKFNVDDQVRISKYRTIFSKGYTQNWTNEIFTIHKIQYTNPTTYILRDHLGEILHGGFYEQELIKVKNPDVYLIDRIIKKKKNMLYVKWRGIPGNSWVKQSDIT